MNFNDDQLLVKIKEKDGAIKSWNITSCDN